MNNRDSTPNNEPPTGLPLKHLLNDESKALLADNNLTLLVNKSPYCYPIRLPFRFAGVPAYFPYTRNRYGENAQIDYEEIDDSELASSNVSTTVERVLSRLGYDLSMTSYWAVYLHTLANPNENGHTKIYSLESKGLNAASVDFAGFAYRAKNGYSARAERNDAANGRLSRTQKLLAMTPKQRAMWEDNWESSVITSLKDVLTPIELWVNDKFLEVTYLDADDGSVVGVDDFCKNERIPFNRRVKMKAGSFRSAPTSS